MAEPTEHELWRCMEATLREIEPAVAEGTARISAHQLVGLAHHAVTRPDDRTAARVAELSAILDALAENPLVVSEWPIVSGAPAAVFDAASRVVVAAVHDAGAAGDEVRDRLRGALVRHLDDDLSSTSHLLAYAPHPASHPASRQSQAPLGAVGIAQSLGRYRTASAVPIPLLEEAAAWLSRHDDADGSERYRAVFGVFADACAQLASLVEFGGATPRPELAIIGTAVQQRSMRDLAELIGTARLVDSTPHGH